MSIERLKLSEEMIKEAEELGKMELGTEKYKATVNGIATLAEKMIEMDRLDVERDKIEVERKKTLIDANRIEDERKDRRTRAATEIAKVAIPVAAATVISFVTMSREINGWIPTNEATRNSLRESLKFFRK